MLWNLVDDKPFDEQKARERLQRHIDTYPFLEVQDIYVWLHQSIFCMQVYQEEHILELEMSVKAYNNLDVDFYLFEPVGLRSEFVRVNILTYYRYGAPLRSLQDMVESTRRRIIRPNILNFKTDWDWVNTWAENRQISITPAQIREFDRNYAFHEHLNVPHSEKFESYYNTFYKVVDWQVFLKRFPEFEDNQDESWFMPHNTYE